jgi:hypothetical protein
MYITDQLPAGNYYIIGPAELHAWQPFRKEAEVIPADLPGDLVLGFLGYELYGLILHNVRSACKGVFSTTV